MLVDEPQTCKKRRFALPIVKECHPERSEGSQQFAGLREKNELRRFFARCARSECQQGVIAMYWFRELGRRFLMLLRRRQFDADLVEEMRLHRVGRARIDACSGGAGGRGVASGGTRLAGRARPWCKAKHRRHKGVRGALSGDPDQIKKYTEQGFLFFQTGTDLGLMAAGA
jgi:hypothetical protein